MSHTLDEAHIESLLHASSDLSNILGCQLEYIFHCKCNQMQRKKNRTEKIDTQTANKKRIEMEGERMIGL